MMVVVLWTLLGGPLTGFADLERDPSYDVPAASSVVPLRAAGQVSTEEAVGAGVLALVNRIAISSGRIAVQRSQRSDVRAFAADVVGAHERIQQRLEQWLAEHNVVGRLLKKASPDGSADDLRISQRLRRTPPKAFDRTFLRATVAMARRSQRFLDALGTGAQNGQPNDDRTFARLLEEVGALLLREQASAARLLAGPDDMPRKQSRAAAQPRS